MRKCIGWCELYLVFLLFYSYVLKQSLWKQWLHFAFRK